MDEWINAASVMHLAVSVSQVDISKNTRFDPQALFVVDEEIKDRCSDL